MKTIGVIAAMDEELTILKSKMEVKLTKSAVGAEFYIGNYMGKSVTAVTCGIGKVNAAVCSQALIDLFAVDYVINTGVAGGVHRDLKIGDLVISSEAVQHDFDCTAFGSYSLGQIPRMEESVFKADKDLISIAQQAASEVGLGHDKKTYLGRIASGDAFIASKEKNKELWDNFGCYCVEMEGAAIAHACFLNKVPFIILRAISDNADNSSNVDFNTFVQEAAKTSSAITQKIIELV